MEHLTIRGAIRYVSKRPDNYDALRGFETFAFTRHSDGGVVMRAMCELAYPKPTVLRDMTSSWDGDDRFVDASLRLMVGDALTESAWLRREGDQIVLEAYAPALGRFSQRIDFPSTIAEVGMHPVVGDGYYCRHVDPAKGARRERVRLLAISPDHRGATASLLTAAELWIEYVGDETVTVPAGTFETHHYRYTDDGTSGLDGQHPDIDVWVTHSTYVYVKGTIGGYFMSAYELVSYEEVQPLG